MTPEEFIALGVTFQGVRTKSPWIVKFGTKFLGAFTNLLDAAACRISYERRRQ